MSNGEWYPTPVPVPPPESAITAGDVVQAAFRLFDVLPFQVRCDMSKLVYLYLQDPAGYAEKKKTILVPPTLKARKP